MELTHLPARYHGLVLLDATFTLSSAPLCCINLRFPHLRTVDPLTGLGSTVLEPASSPTSAVRSDPFVPVGKHTVALGVFLATYVPTSPFQ